MPPFLEQRPFLAAMIHLGATPGAPRAREGCDAVIGRAEEEARLLSDAGVDAIVLENMHDCPYLNRDVGPEVVAVMTAALDAVRDAAGGDFVLGVQILAGANREALAAAQAVGASFVRAEGFVFAHVADEGIMPDADAGRLLRYRREIGAENVRVFADIKKKHSAHAITADVGLAASARAAEFFGADGLIVTGDETGQPVSLDHLREVRKATRLPVIVGSGVTPESIPDLSPHADGFIVGSYFKRDGVWHNPPDPTRLRDLVDAVRASRRDL
jgi:membrane complex biogenesis BtpA family protein